MKDDFICALSGLTPTQEEEENVQEGIPENWIEIRIRRVFPGSKYEILQQLKQQAINMTLAQIPEESHDDALETVQVQVDAQYYAYEQSLKEYDVEEDVIYIAPPESDENILAEYKKLQEALGFDALLYEDDGSSDDVDDEEDGNENAESEAEQAEKSDS